MIEWTAFVTRVKTADMVDATIEATADDVEDMDLAAIWRIGKGLPPKPGYGADEEFELTVLKNHVGVVIYEAGQEGDCDVLEEEFDEDD